QASTRASSATAAAMASESSLAIRFTTSSIRDLLIAQRAAGSGKPGQIPIQPRRGVAEGSGAKVNHMKGLRRGNAGTFYTHRAAVAIDEQPGQFPYTRGIQPTMYRGRLWTMRQYAGFG